MVDPALADVTKMKEALRQQATVGEVCDAVRSVFGVYRPTETF